MGALRKAVATGRLSAASVITTASHVVAERIPTRPEFEFAHDVKVQNPIYFSVLLVGMCRFATILSVSAALN